MVQSSEDETSQQRPPAWIAFLAICILIAAASWLKGGTVTPTQSLWMTGTAMWLGLLVIIGYVELLFRRMLGFKSAIWGLGVALAIVGYVCHADAARYVNGIFHVDASALPMTVAAGTALLMFAFFKWGMLGACGLSALILAVMAFDRDPDEDSMNAIAKFCTAIAAVMFSGFAFLVAHYQLSDDMLRPKLYRIAHDTDFSSVYDCVGHDPRELDALFIGPDQRRVLFAPALDNEDLQGQSSGRAAIMLPVQIPTAFEETDCVAPPWPRPPTVSTDP